MATIASKLVNQLHGLPASDIPPRVHARAALCMEDTLGVALAALASGAGTAGVALARQAGPGRVSVWGAGFGAPLSDAVLANGMLAHALDFDDLHAAAVMHSSAAVVPAALGLAQHLGASPREMLAAAIVGYEVAARLGRLAPGRFQLHGFQSTSVLGTFATTSVAARLLGLDAAQALHAFGIAGSMAAGSMEFLADGSSVKQMHPGWAASAGIKAAQLAKAGFTGPATVFEGRFGIFRSYARAEVDASRIDARIGDPWEVELMGPKPYPACLCVHPQVQAMLQLREAGSIAAERWDDIEEIACEVPDLYVPLVYEPRERKLNVQTAYEARFSAPYCMARALLDGHLDNGSFDAAQRADPIARAIASRVTWKVAALPEYPASFPARVRVTLRGGRVHEAYVRHNLGSPANPMDEAQLGAKFLACAEPAVGHSAARRLHLALRALPDAQDMDRFNAALAAALLSETHDGHENQRPASAG
ncbi:MmgE/PrpD family protein [Variovorax sp. PBL-E5]|uniref:MmgE/PrpD family protein n=1 Tax=Variovorax sp. PBL-E5 TaxID=434014 RepID=UPI001317ADDB|nr:MmgE/PrpD family protein [Variovorax sp. PBL-E5]VTU16775.1 MmgE/PrpD family protein [Variovorax sp. PBL-E5]